MDISSPTAIARLILPQVPFLCKTALWHSLWLSPTSTKWDLKTELIVGTIRALLASPNTKPASVQQKTSLKDPGIKGKMWISKVVFPTPGETDVKSLLVNAVDDLKEGGETYTIPDIIPVEAEWTGYRSNVPSNRPRPDLSEAQHYSKLMAEVSSDVTILYLHGGAHFLMDPASHRDICSRLAHLTNGRCLSVRYRLAPQNAFPAALLDAFVAYLSLLYPPPGAYHDPVPASHIVIAGDSAGGNLALALQQLLLQIRHSSTSKASSIRFHNHSISLPLPFPAGCASCSAWADMTRAMPSIQKNAHYDYLPPPLTRDQVSRFPADEIWPTKPPRGDLYCETSMLCHPLTSPLAAKDWSGSCPLWLGYGEEMLADEGKFIASRAAEQGVTVVWEQWEAMPHCFPLILLGSPVSKKFFRDWADFCINAVGEGPEKEGAKLETRGTWFEAKTMKEKEVSVRKLSAIGDEEVKRRMQECRDARHLGIDGEGKMLPKL